MSAGRVVLDHATMRRTPETCHPPRARLSRPSPPCQGQAARGRFASLDTAATARGMAAIEEDGEGRARIGAEDRGSPGH